MIGYELNPKQKRGGSFMKDIFKDDPEFNNIKDKLDEAIDNMDISEIEKQLAKLAHDNPLPYQIEDSRLFAKRIIKQNKKGDDTMKINYKKFGTLVASVLLTITIGLTAAYAMSLFQEFNFFNKDTTVNIRSNQNLSEEEAKKINEEVSKMFGMEASETSNNQGNRQETSKETGIKSFSNIKEVKEALGIDIVLPSYVPVDFEMNKNVNVQSTINDNFNIYTTYDSKENTERFLGVTVITKNLPEDSTVMTVTDVVHKGFYTTPAGTKYTLMDDDAAVIATIEINNIQYALIFQGISEDEMHKVIDSVNLEIYKK